MPQVHITLSQELLDAIDRHKDVRIPRSAYIRDLIERDVRGDQISKAVVDLGTQTITGGLEDAGEAMRRADQEWARTHRTRWPPGIKIQRTDPT